jgi:8-oxo-dGTP pyrophosphatase MutT (NUDIX family)
MIGPEAVSRIVAAFDDSSDGAASKSRELILMLLAMTPAPFSRSQFTPGHITCTGLVVSPCGERLLLVHHRRLARWLLPGGHVEPEELENPACGIADVARREVVEETGALLLEDAAPALCGVDVHGIPGKGMEPFHLHHDLVFRFQAASEAVRISAESRAAAWCAPGEFDRYGVPESVRLCWARLRGRVLS